MAVITNRYIAIKTHINGAPKESDFDFKTETISLSVEPGSNDVIVKTLYLSIDPYQINRMKTSSSSQKASVFAAAITPGEAVDAVGVGKVVASGHPDFKKDDLVSGVISWGEYSIVKGGKMLNVVNLMGFPLSYHVSILGFSGLTAYAGFFQLCKPKKGEKVFVSAASGSVGNLVGQYAKLFGCYVVGCAGTNQKVDLLKEKLGFDDAFNYKEEIDLESALKRYFPDGIDIYFDNVGSEMLEGAVANMNIFGRVVVCGAIAEYTDARKRARLDMLDIIYKRINIQGFLAIDHLNVHGDFILTTVDHLQNDRIQVLEDISHGLENVPNAFLGLFSGDNVGKKIVHVADA
ncbi:NADPH-dependent oxidoreductase 2-alkenal reductase-like [Diospyros lotus]|uniref:NADPH-dependent oxidoreductase 2-alkenal reductase-like n=1 Tax=Diospyros lotus TaxID=55363 RepID=UPI0022514C86|nr:NADPH-dependent oxidoreductase 2-alkenal reductase-like [Diospyros lotus]